MVRRGTMDLDLNTEDFEHKLGFYDETCEKI